MSNLTDKFIIKGTDLEELQSWCKKNNYDQFRAKQIYQWMYSHQKFDPNQMTNLSKNIIHNLKDNCIIKTLCIEKISKSYYNKTNKFLFKTIDSQFIESVSMIESKRHTICISSQIGCNVGCDFCATAKMGLIRNLKAGEIIDQLSIIMKEIKEPITNIVFMGMGEPFLNYNEVMKAADIFHHKFGFGFSARRITISTVGILSKINQFYKEKRKYKLAISLNASNNYDRTKIIPINNKWPITDLVKVVKENSNKHYNITFEYVLLSGINDSSEDALALSNILKGLDCKLNIIPYNEINGNYKRPKKEMIENFIKILFKKKDKYKILVRWSKGTDIDAGCGQLAIQNKYHE